MPWTSIYGLFFKLQATQTVEKNWLKGKPKKSRKKLVYTYQEAIIFQPKLLCAENSSGYGSHYPSWCAQLGEKIEYSI